MFTGIIEEIGEIKSFQCNTVLEVSCHKILEDVKLGDSIAINGVCQTVIEFSKNSFKVEVSPETLAVTNFSQLKSGMKVNLERALTPTTRMGGHIVQGHIDQTGELLKVEKLDNFYNMYFETSDTKYIVNDKLRDVIKNNLKIMDQTAFALAKDNNLPIVVFKLSDIDSVKKIIEGDGSQSNPFIIEEEI